MNRSVYSLVLMDDVIRRIDELAYAMHTSQSNQSDFGGKIADGYAGNAVSGYISIFRAIDTAA